MTSTDYTGPLLAVRQENDAVALGIWWWDPDLRVRPDPLTGLTAKLAFDMLCKEHVGEIYLAVNPAGLPSWEVPRNRGKHRWSIGLTPGMR